MHHAPAKPIFPYVLFIFLTACNFRVSPSATPQLTAIPLPEPRLTVAYLDNDTLYLWREGDSTSQPIAEDANPSIVLAPDGKHVAFTRGDDGAQQTLWVASADGINQQQLIELGEIPAQGSARALIDEIRWLDETTLYFNTYQSYEWGYQQDNNLYRVTIGTETESASSSPRLILPPGAGGQFAFSPDRQHIAVVYPGQYDTEKGRVLILDPLSEQARTALEFTAVSTASEIPFYPPLYWSSDSATVRVPIPNRDLVYDEAIAPPVELWTLPIDGESHISGYVPASFDGLPRWSDRTDTMLYLQRHPDEPAMYDLYLADADGGSSQSYADGSSEILSAQWMPGDNRFVFMRGTMLMLGQRGESPQPIDTNVLRWTLAENVVIYTSHSSGETELWSWKADSAQSSTLISTVPESVLFDAVAAP